jgi:hypothetical protein
MKNAIKYLGIIALAAVIGFSFVSCDEGDSGGTTTIITPPTTSITITGISGKTGTVALGLFNSILDSEPAAGGEGRVSSSVKFTLKDKNNNDWNGRGSYYLAIAFADGTGYYYTDGKSFLELAITSMGDYSKLPRYNISSASSTISIDKFVYVD